MAWEGDAGAGKVMHSGPETQIRLAKPEQGLCDSKV